MGIVEKTEWLDSSEGVPQGNILSPLLANIYLHPFDVEMTSKNYNYIRYADDFVVLCRFRDEALQAFTHSATFLHQHLRLRLNKENQPCRHIRDGFAFLGFFFKGKRKTIADAKIRKIKDRIPRVLNEYSTIGTAESIKKLNESIIGWRQYYSLGDTADQFQFLDNILFYKLSAYLKRNINKNIGTPVLRDAIYKVEFFLKKNAKERERLLELIIAHSKITPKEQPAAGSATSRIQPVPVSEAVEKKKEEYRKILCRNSSLVIAEPGSFVEKSSNRIMVLNKGKRIREIPLFRLKGVLILSTGIKISAVVIKYCAHRQIPVHFIDPGGNTYAAAYNPAIQKANPYPTQPGVSHETRGLKLAAALLRGKLLNQVNLLQYFRSHEDIELEFKNECAGSLKEMDSLLKKIELLHDEENLPEMKGNLTTLRDKAHSSYWRAVKALLHRYVYLGKKKDSNSDGLVDSLLNFGNGILYSKVLGVVVSTGLNYRTDILYNPTKTKSTLVFEVSSLFRQAVVDRIIFEMLRNNEKLEMNDLILSLKTRGKLASAILNKLDEKSRCRNRLIPYSEIIRQQSLNITACIEKGGEFEPFVKRYDESQNNR
jgi:CRISPR-associated endonuclease Cas1